MNLCGGAVCGDDSSAPARQTSKISRAVQHLRHTKVICRYRHNFKCSCKGFVTRHRAPTSIWVTGICRDSSSLRVPYPGGAFPKVVKCFFFFFLIGIEWNAKFHNHCEQRLCKICRAWLNVLTKHTVFYHKFNFWSIFCSVFWGKNNRKCRVKVFLLKY